MQSLGKRKNRIEYAAKESDSMEYGTLSQNEKEEKKKRKKKNLSRHEPTIKYLPDFFF